MTEISEPTSLDSLSKHYFRGRDWIFSHPSSLTEPHVASEINLPTALKGVSPEESLIATTAMLVESTLISD